MEELYDQYKSLLFTLAYQLTGPAADAEDAVQDVFVKACDVHPERLGGAEGLFVQNGHQSLPQSAKVGTEEKGIVRRSMAPRTDFYAGDGFARDGGRPPRSAVLRCARPA